MPEAARLSPRGAERLDSCAMNEKQEVAAAKVPLAPEELSVRLAMLCADCHVAAHESFEKAGLADLPRDEANHRAAGARLAHAAAILAMAIVRISGETRHRIIVEHER